MGFLVRSEIEGLIDSLLEADPDAGAAAEPGRIGRIADTVSRRFAIPSEIATGLVKQGLSRGLARQGDSGLELVPELAPGRLTKLDSSWRPKANRPKNVVPGKRTLTARLSEQLGDRSRANAQSILRGSRPELISRFGAVPNRSEIFARRFDELLRSGSGNRRDLILMNAAAASDAGLLNATLDELSNRPLIGGRNPLELLDRTTGGATGELVAGAWDGKSDPTRRDKRGDDSLGAEFGGIDGGAVRGDLGAQLEDIEFATHVRLAELRGAAGDRARRWGRNARGLGREALANSELVRVLKPHAKTAWRAADEASSGQLTQLGRSATTLAGAFSRFVDTPVGATVQPSPLMMVARRENATDADAGIEDGALANLEANLSGGGQPLPAELAERMAGLLSHDFSHVRVHTGARVGSSADSIGARAFTVGSHIYFNDGEWAPGALAFERLLIHELTHVIQSDAGRLTADGNGRFTDPSDAVEQEARAAESLAGGSSAGAVSKNGAGGASGTKPKLGSVLRDAWQPFDHSPSSQTKQTSEQPAASHTTKDGDGKVARLGMPGFVSDAAGWVGDKAGDAADAVGDAATGALAAIVRRVSPGLADLISKGPAELIKTALKSGVSALLSPITGSFEALGGLLATLKSSFTAAFTFIKGLLSDDPNPKCCTAVTDFITAIRKAATAVANNSAVKTVGAAIGRAGSVFKSVATFVLSPVFDALKTSLGASWGALKTVGTTIGGWVSTVKNYSSKAWNWAAGKLGFGGEGGGVWDWLKGKAKAVWTPIADTLKPLGGPAKVVVGGLAMFTGLPQLYALIKYGPKVIEAVQWLWANKGDPELAAKAREKYGDALGTVIDGVNGFGEAMGSAADWLVTTTKKLGTGLLSLGQKVTGIPLVSMAGSAINAVSTKVNDVASWGTTVFKAAYADIKGGVKRFVKIAKPYMGVVTSIGMAILNPTMIPMILAGWAWQALPDCVKAPIIDLLLDAAIMFLRSLPNLFLFGPLWPILKTGVLGFLEGLRGLKPDEKEQASNKLAKIISGGSPAFILGFVKGFAVGVWEGITDPFKIIIMAIKGLGALASWFGGIAGQAFGEGGAKPAAEPEAPAAPTAEGPEGAANDNATAPAAAVPSGPTAPGGNQSGNPTKAEFGTRLREMGSELGPPVATAGQTALPAAKAAFGGGGGGGMTFEGLVAKMGSLWGKMEAAIRAGAAGLAAKACKLLLQPGAESKMGYGVGWLAGTITFEVILAVLTAGAWQPVSAAAKALKVFAKILDWTGAALGAAFKVIGKVGGLIKKALSGLRSALGSAGGAAQRLLGALGDIGNKLVNYASELMSRFGRGVGDDVAERAAREGAEVATERTAREGAEVASERAGRESAEAAGDRAGREGAEESGEQGAKQGDEAGGKDGPDGKKKDTADPAEKARVVAEAKVVAEGMDKAGTPGPAIVAALRSSFMSRYGWINNFVMEPAGVYMIASKWKLIDLEFADEIAGHVKKLKHNEQKKAVGNLDFTTNPKVADEIGEVWEDAFAKHYDELRKTLDEAVAKKKAMGLARKDAKTFATKQAKEVAAARGKADVASGAAYKSGAEDGFAPTRASFDAGTHGARAKELSTQFNGKSLSEVSSTLNADAAAGKCIKDSTPTPQGPQDAYLYPDGSLARVKPNGDGINSSGPMYSVEVIKKDVPTPTNQDDVAFKLGGDGQPVPKGSEAELNNPFDKGKNNDQWREWMREVINSGHHKTVEPPVSTVVPSGGSAVPTGAVDDVAEVTAKKADEVGETTTVASGPLKAADGQADDAAAVVKQPSSNIDELYKAAEEAHQELTTLSNKIANGNNGEAMVPGLKGRPRAMEKADADYGGDAGRLVDLARSSVVFDTVDDLKKGLTKLEGSVDIVRKKDRFATPTAEGYRDVTLNVRMSNGHIAEVQLHLRSVLDVKNGPGHKLYEEARSIKALASKEGRDLTAAETKRIAEIADESKKLYGDAFEVGTTGAKRQADNAPTDETKGILGDLRREAGHQKEKYFPPSDNQVREEFLESLSGDTRKLAETLSVEDLRKIYPTGRIPANFRDLAMGEGFLGFARKNPEKARVLADAADWSSKKDVAKWVSELGLDGASKRFAKRLPKVQPNPKLKGFQDAYRSGSDTSKTTPDVVVRATRDHDTGGAFAVDGVGKRSSDVVQYEVMGPEQLIVNGKPLESMDGVLVFGGHGSKYGIGTKAGLGNTAEAEAVVAKIIEANGSIKHVVLDACDQRNLRIIGGSNAQAFQTKVRKLLKKEGYTGKVDVLAPSKPGSTQGNSIQSIDGSPTNFTPADDGGVAHFGGAEALEIVAGAYVVAGTGLAVYVALDD